MSHQWSCKHKCAECPGVDRYCELVIQARKDRELIKELTEENLHLRRQAADLDASGKILEDLNRLTATLLKE